MKLTTTLLYCVLWLTGTIGVYAMPPEDIAIGSGLAKPFSPAEYDFHTMIDANTLQMFITNQGFFAHDYYSIFGGGNGLYYPRGTNLTAVYSAGIWLGGIIENHPAVVKADYGYYLDYFPGPIVNGTIQHDRPEFKVYKIFKTLKETGFYDNPRPSDDVDSQEVWDDYHNWPAGDGAPVDEDGTPLIIEDQTLWCVFNGFNRGLVGRAVEIQNTAFAKDHAGPLGKTIFMKYTLINEGVHAIEDMYVSFWADPDLGVPDDDFVGCDPDLNLGFCYNSTSSDDEYGSTPPAVGFEFLQGPRVPSPEQTARAQYGWHPGFRNLPMTSFVKYINGSDPGNEQQIYLYMQGLDGSRDGATIIDPTSGNPTTFMLSGDPLGPSGWVDCCVSYTIGTIVNLDFLETHGPEGMPVDPPEDVWWSWNSTNEYYLGSDQDSNIARVDWRHHIGEDVWEIRFTASGSEYYDWSTEEEFPNRAPFEVWNMAGGTDGNPTDTRIQFAIVDDDESGGWSPGDRTYFVECEYYEPLPEYMEYTWDDDFRIGRIRINDSAPQEGTIIKIATTDIDTVDYDTTTTGGDCRYMLSSGPFDMAPGDTQEVWMAVIVGQGDDNLSSVTDLKYNAHYVQEIFESQYRTPNALKVCDVHATGNSVVSGIWALYKKPLLHEQWEELPNTLNLYLTLCEPAVLATGDLARVYVDTNQNGILEEDEQYPAALIGTSGSPAREVTIRVDLGDHPAVEGTRVALYALAGRTITDEYGQPVDQLQVNTTFAHEGNQEPAARTGSNGSKVYALEVNYPNPFNTLTRMAYALAETGPVRIDIYNILGRRIRTLVDEVKPAGRHEVLWDGTDDQGTPVASGIFFYKIEAGQFVETRKMVLMK